MTSHPLPTTRLNPLNDFLFLKMMGEKGDEVQLLAFLNAVLGRTGEKQLKAVEIRDDQKLTGERLNDKTVILDVWAQVDTGEWVDIEVQLRNYWDMPERSLYYWSSRYYQSLRAGQQYSEVSKVIAVNIVDFEFMPDKGLKGFHTCFHLCEDEQKEVLLTDVLEIHFIDMVRFRRLKEKDVRNDTLQRWAVYFDQYSAPDLLAEVISMDNAIQKAQERVDFVLQDEAAFNDYCMRQRALLDWNSAIHGAIKEGFSQGKQEGKQEGRKEGKQEKLREIVEKALARGLNREDIAGITGLSLDEIAKL